jgi:NAD(P) transhydrogenase
MRNRYDAIVIGAGPAGWAAAVQGSKLGLQVAIVEKSIQVGGACIHTGTVPSKTLRQAILDLVAVRRGGELGLVSSFGRPLGVQDLMRRKDAVIEKQVRTIQSFLERNRIDLIPGSASFVSPREIRVATAHSEEIFEADQLVIATGSRPRRPDNIGFDDRLICDSDSILSLDEIPRTLAVLGGGVIGCEYACMFAALGIRVTLVDRRESLMRFLDTTIVESLAFQMRELGINILMREDLESIGTETLGRMQRAVLKLRSGREVKAERVLVAAGRESNTGALNLESVGIETDSSGLIKVDERFRTTQSTILAVGDVIGFPALAGTSMHQGRQAMLCAAGRDARAIQHLPIAIYTIPEISMVGYTEEECREKGIAYETGLARYSESTRGQILGTSSGLLKLVFRRKDRVLVGIHVIGEGASELVHIGMMLVQSGGTLDTLVDSVFNYPTLSEAYRVAALDGMNRL